MTDFTTGDDTTAATPTRQPAVFIPHGGGPCFFMDWSPADAWDGLAAHLRAIPTMLPERPRAIAVISAHWEDDAVAVTSHPTPSLLFDYFGFPAHTYELSYPAPGDPALAQRIVDLVGGAGLPARLDGQRGWDHGVFVPLLVMFPDADIPVVEISLRSGLDPAEHVAIGQALAPLRDEGVLLIGSGFSYHNLRGMDPSYAEPSERFDAWLAQAMTSAPDERAEALTHWVDAPAARIAHPREEHLLPAMVIAGAAGSDPVVHTYDDHVMGIKVSGFAAGTPAAA